MVSEDKEVIFIPVASCPKTRLYVSSSHVFLSGQSAIASQPYTAEEAPWPYYAGVRKL